MNKFEQVREIVKNFQGSKKDLLDKICSDLQITRPNASVYLYKISKQQDKVENLPVSQPVKKEKVPEKPIVRIDRPYAGSQILEYMNEMDNRVNNGYSTMSIQEYFELKKNLEVLL
jgi:hypothetical protein